MANNLIIGYDLNAPGQNYDNVINVIKSLGGWAKLQKSLWFVSSSYSASQARDIIKGAMDKNDNVFVVDALNNDSAWFGVVAEASEYVVKNWSQR